MRKLPKHFFVAFVVFTLTVIFTIQSQAISTFSENGIVFSQLENNTVSVYDIDENTSSVVVPDKTKGGFVISVDNYALQQNSSITSIDFSKAVHLTTIGIMSFNECSSLSGKVYLPHYITSVGNAAFQDCSSIESLVYSARTPVISEQCFNRCTSLQSVKISENVTTIDKLAFANCPNLTEIKIPNSVTNIHYTAFNNSENIVIVCKTDSYAHKYAVENNMEFILSDKYILGDVNGDEEINIMDATIIQKKSLGIATADVVSNYDVVADVNRDGIVNIRDVTLIQMYVAGIITEF